MARKLIDQEEAAKMLGVSIEEIGSLRDRKKLFPFRDGDQWKYKPEEIERLRAEMQEEKDDKAAGSSNWTGDSNLGDIDLEPVEDLDSILLSEVELGKSSTEGASTIIGKLMEGEDADLPVAEAKPTKQAKPAKPVTGDSGITLAGESKGKGDSDITLAGEGKGDSAVTLAGDTGLGIAGGSSGFSVAGDSNITLAGDSSIGLASSDIQLKGGSDPKKKGGSSDKLFGSDALKLSDDELSLIGSSPRMDRPGEGSKKGLGSSIKLGDEEIEVVLGGSDVTQSPADSGIQLISASDSGLSLEQPLELGSSAKRLLDLTDEAATDKSPGSESEVDIKADDDFLLTEMGDQVEESSDSGSQVIALDTDEELSSGMFAPAGGAGLLEEEPSSGTPLSGAPLLSGAPGLSVSPGLMGEPMAAPAEAPFTGANVFALSACAILLFLCGMVIYDLIRNMWSWDGPYAIGSDIAHSIGGVFGWFER